MKTPLTGAHAAQYVLSPSNAYSHGTVMGGGNTVLIVDTLVAELNGHIVW